MRSLAVFHFRKLDESVLEFDPVPQLFIANNIQS
jgi:hypothetical protein